MRGKIPGFHEQTTPSSWPILPWRTTKVHDSDRLWITKKLKLLIHKRQNTFTRFGKHSIIYKQLRNKVQSEIRLAKQHYYKHKVSDLEQANAKKWWKQIKILSGQTCHKEWCHQFLDSECPDTEALADKLNDFFVGLTDNLSPLPVPELNLQSVPAEFLVCEKEVFTSLSALNIFKATGPDQIPNRIVKEFAQQLAPVIKDITDQSQRAIFHTYWNTQSSIQSRKYLHLRRKKKT